MNLLDIIILVCFIPALIKGISKGFIDQAFSLVSLILGVWLSFHFSTPVSSWLHGFLDVNPTVLQVIVFALILIVVVFGLRLVGNMVEKLIKIAMMGWLNRLLGVAFAFFTTFLLVGLLVILFDTLNTTLSIVPQETIDSSLLYKPIKDIAGIVFPYLKELIFNK